MKSETIDFICRKNVLVTAQKCSLFVLVVDEALKQEPVIFPHSCATVDRCLSVGLLMLGVL